MVALLICSILLTRARGEELADLLLPLIEGHQGQVAVAVKQLSSGEQFQYQADQPMPTASLIKFPLMAATYHAAANGEVDLGQEIVLKDEDKVPGSGILTEHFSAGTRITLRDAIRLMITYSDNTATNLVVDQVGLPATAEFMEELGLEETKLHSKVYRRDTSIYPERSKLYGLGSTTATEMLRLFEMLHREELVSSSASQAMREHLLTCDDDTKLARFLPRVQLAHKTGAINATRCDAGCLETPSGPIVICVLTTENQDQSWGDNNAAEVLCGRIAQRVFNHFNPDSTSVKPVASGRLQMGSQGILVESLQRTLNERLEPSPKMSVDGDFGPITEAAVIAFQKSRGLEANGVVDEATWKALGTLVEESGELQDLTPIEKAPRDSLIGPPWVTCKAYAIMDADSGKLLFDSRGDKQLDPASTTKMMTGYLVTALAQVQPEVLEETVTFSPRADGTIGSSATVRAGEQIAVDDLLYGLLLPSGNDASVALAEHFGRRMLEFVQSDEHSESDEQPEPSKQLDNYDAFIQAMNLMASQLGMRGTHFVNPHGLTDDDHQVTAHDLCRLAQAAVQVPLFAKIAATPQYQCLVRGPSGYQRALRWKNTNRLLRTEGYLGVKTGTTSRAGACLVSMGEREGRKLIVAVLGASSSDARYVDTRNLFRWAWNQLNQPEAQ